MATDGQYPDKAHNNGLQPSAPAAIVRRRG